MAKTEVPITGSVLSWAMEEAGFDDTALAERARVSANDVRAWREGTARPGRTEFKAIVQAVRRPSAIFFMPEPPVRAALPTAFRAAPGARNHQLSPAALRAIRRARRVQQAVGWLYAGVEGRDPVAVPALSWATHDARSEGAALRASFGVPLNEQTRWKNVGEALRSWRSLFDAQGILMFALELGRDEIRGFSAWHNHAPLIAVNTGYTPGARIYTLAHELAHLATRTDSACFDWISLERMVQAGSLAFSRQVKDEVTGMLHPDAPGVWADGVFPLLQHPAEPDIKYVHQVMSSPASAVVDPDKTREDGDPYVIALGLQLIAEAWNVCVVTDDRLDNPARIAMSKACELLGVPWCCLVDFLSGL